MQRGGPPSGIIICFHAGDQFKWQIVQGGDVLRRKQYHNESWSVHITELALLANQIPRTTWILDTKPADASEPLDKAIIAVFTAYAHRATTNFNNQATRQKSGD